MTAIDPMQVPHAVQAPSRLGEELPVFCEKCGYSLHGLVQVRCEHCQILHFHCPECGHHQPINTLRPAAQRIIGRLRSVWLVGVVVFKLNFFGWLLFAWVVMGAEWSYQYQFRGGLQPVVTLREPDWEAYFAFGLFAIAFATFGRMLLLRWRRGIFVGCVLGALIVSAVILGAWIQTRDHGVPMQLTFDWMLLLIWTFGIAALAATVVWPIWVALVRALLPRKTAGSLLQWQKLQSDRSASSLAIE